MSEDKKVKIWNRSKGHHTMVYQDGLRKISIPSGGSAHVPLEEVYYTDSSTRSFKKGILEIDLTEKELREELGYSERNPASYTDKEIEELLKGSLKKITDKLEGLQEFHAFQKIMDVARTLDLAQSKVKFLEELTGMKYDDELIEEEKKQKSAKKTK